MTIVTERPPTMNPTGRMFNAPYNPDQDVPPYERTRTMNQHPLVESWLTRSRDLGHDPQVNYNNWGGTYYTAACRKCPATMSLEMHQTRGLVVGYSARGVAYKRQCAPTPSETDTGRRVAAAIADAEWPT